MNDSATQGALDAMVRGIMERKMEAATGMRPLPQEAATADALPPAPDKYRAVVNDVHWASMVDRFTRMHQELDQLQQALMGALGIDQLEDVLGPRTEPPSPYADAVVAPAEPSEWTPPPAHDPGHWTCPEHHIGEPRISRKGRPFHTCTQCEEFEHLQ